MRAIDTNVIVRFLVADDKLQAARAKAAIEAGEVFVSLTVLLESEWVLRSGYGFTFEQVAGALRDFAGLPNVSVENPPLLALALEWGEAGMGFADALHLAKAEGCDAFLTFDRKLAKLAIDHSTIEVQLL